VQARVPQRANYRTTGRKVGVRGPSSLYRLMPSDPSHSGAYTVQIIFAPPLELHPVLFSMAGTSASHSSIVAIKAFVLIWPAPL